MANTLALLGVGAAVSAGAAFDSDAQAVIDNMDVAPDGARQIVINDLVLDLKAAGLWTKIDELYVHAAHDAQAARLNWKNPTGTDLAVTSAPTFTADVGYRGDASDDLLTNATDLNALTLYQQNSGHIAQWLDLASTGATRSMGCATSADVFLRAVEGGAMAGRVNQGATTDFAGTASQPLSIILSRRGASEVESYVDGVHDADGAESSSAVVAERLTILGAGGTFSDARVSASSIGSGLTDTEAGAWHTCISDYLAAL